MDKRLLITFTLLLISSLGVMAQNDSVLHQQLSDPSASANPKPAPEMAIQAQGKGSKLIDSIKYNQPTGIPMLRSYKKKVVRRYKVVSYTKPGSETSRDTIWEDLSGNSASGLTSSNSSAKTIAGDTNSYSESVSPTVSTLPTAVFTQTSVAGNWSAESRTRQLDIKMIKTGKRALTIPDLVQMLKTEVVTRPDSDGIFPLEDQEAILSLSTNAVGWFLLNSNVTTEISIGEGWAIGIPLYFGALDWGRSTRKVRLFGGRLELRKYYPIGKNKGYNRIKGEWFVGGAFDLSLFNVAFPGGKWRYQSRHCHDLAVGFSALFGYRRFLSQDRRWFMDFGLGAGVYDLHYDRYFNNNKHYYDAKHRTKFLVDYIGVSIGYRFDLRKKISNNPFRQLNIH